MLFRAKVCSIDFGYILYKIVNLQKLYGLYEINRSFNKAFIFCVVKLFLENKTKLNKKQQHLYDHKINNEIVISNKIKPMIVAY